MDDERLDRDLAMTIGKLRLFSKHSLSEARGRLCLDQIVGEVRLANGCISRELLPFDTRGNTHRGRDGTEDGRGDLEHAVDAAGCSHSWRGQDGEIRVGLDVVDQISGAFEPTERVSVQDPRPSGC